MRVKPIFSALMLTAFMMLPVVAPPSFGHPLGSGQAIASVTVYPYSYNSTWQNAMDGGLSAWNSTSSPAYISKNSNSGSTATAASYADTWYGLYNRCGDSCYYIKLNSRTISRDASNISNFIQSVFVHEYGHAFNLAHNSVTSIMWDGRNRNNMKNPQQHDIDDVKADD